MTPIVPGYSRKSRRLAGAKERKAVLSGDWVDWRRIDYPHGPPGDGWLREVRWAMTNDLYAVLCRPLPNGVHLAIRTASSLEPPWRDKQRIKNELFGPERWAIEVMPSASMLVDGADMHHIFVFPEGVIAPFSL